jgi:hypothetical protein
MDFGQKMMQGTSLVENGFTLTKSDAFTDSTLRPDQRHRGFANRDRQTTPGRDHALQISVKRRQKMTIETARMQRPCSERVFALVATAIARGT